MIQILCNDAYSLSRSVNFCFWCVFGRYLWVGDVIDQTTQELTYFCRPSKSKEKGNVERCN